MSAGKRRHQITVEKEAAGARGRFGATTNNWADHCRAWAEFIYQGGDVGPDAGRDAGRGRVKVRMRATGKTKAILPKDRVLVESTGDRFEVQQVDAVTQRADVFLVVEGPLSPEVANG